MANRKMRRVGTVVRDANDKTIVVAYAWSQTHRIYKRSRRRITKFVAHDEHNEASIGDRVEIEECRPYSATKRWRLCRIIAQVDVVTGTEAPEVISESDVQTEEPVAETPAAEEPTAEAPAAEEPVAEVAEAPVTETEQSEPEPEAAQTAEAPVAEESPGSETSDAVASEETTTTDEAADAQPAAEVETETATAPATDEAEQKQGEQQQ